jgi:acyl dehydratase
MLIDSPWSRTLAGPPSLGSSAERSRTTCMRDVELFTEMTGDKNPIHYDIELASASPFGGLIVQGGSRRGFSTPLWRKIFPGLAQCFLKQTGAF